MKNIVKLFGIIAVAAVIMFSMAACEDEDDGGSSEISGEVTAAGSDGGYIYFFIRAWDGGDPDESCTITTDLPTPADSFKLYGDKIITADSGYATDKIYCSSLKAGQKVKWTAKVENGKLKPNNERSNSYTVYIQYISK